MAVSAFRLLSTLICLASSHVFSKKEAFFMMWTPAAVLGVFAASVAQVYSVEQDYAVQTGHISMNDSEITLLINSTYEIIEDYDISLTSNETEILELREKLPSSTTTSTATTTIEAPSTTKKPIRMHKIRRPVVDAPTSTTTATSTTANPCRKYSEAEKYKILEGHGGRNQMYMAASVDEAARNFAESVVVPTMATAPITLPFSDHVSKKASSNCDPRCELIKSVLEDEISRRNGSTWMAARMYADALNYSETEDSKIKSCFLGDFIPVGSCSELGESVSGTHESLCSDCHGLYMMSSNCFPRFFNAIKCNAQEMACIFDTFSDKAHGQCNMQTLSFKVLQNVGDEKCEEWSIQQIELPVACQCSLSRNSWLRSKPPKPF
ncbi:unnamed protein product [Caenorhabditis auriculariae]|uniref:Uncharacterized protein n=1 Tax=Caenorhabditis auriculariae TaxID=2777116 RepID=A0A8S1HS45_9PELO|nr:unnamed protein product [Caenorhabditis auriculariae]